MPHLVPVREFQSVADMQAHAAAVKARMFAPRPVAPKAIEPASAPAPKASPFAWDRVVQRTREAYPELLMPPSDAQRLGRATHRGSDIARVTHAVTGFSFTHLASMSRKADLVKARQIAFWLLLRRAGKTLPQAGKILGGRDHTTALHGVRRVDGVIVALGISVVDDPEAMASALWAADWPKGYVARPRA